MFHCYNENQTNRFLIIKKFQDALWYNSGHFLSQKSALKNMTLFSFVWLTPVWSGKKVMYKKN